MVQASSSRAAIAAVRTAHREKIRAEIWSKVPGGRPACLDEPDKPKKPRPRRRETVEIFYAHKEPGLKPNPKSAEYADGYASQKGGCWWRGCPHFHQSQEFADWQAGWHKAYNKA